MVRLQLASPQKLHQMLYCLNSTMVRLQHECCIYSLQRENRLNSTMVRLQPEEWEAIPHSSYKSQFHYGSITTIAVGATAEPIFVSLNSTMVRLQLVELFGVQAVLLVCLNSTMVRLQPQRSRLKNNDEIGLNSTMVRLQQIKI